LLKDEHQLQEGEVLLGRYRIRKLIKVGGMGAVYQAEDTAVEGKLCAVKEMLDTFSTPSERQAAIDRFLSEIQVLGGLMHPNIPQIADHFVVQNSFYFVMDFLEGTDLSSLLHREGTPGLPEYKVMEWILQACDALDYIHSMKTPVVHRDIKPSNLFLRQTDGRILLIDFGIARVSHPQEGFWLGTPGYAPPEQQMGRPEPRSDLYALGATMHELLSGRKPDESFKFPPLEQMCVKTEPELENLVFRLLSLNPDDRYSSAMELRESLQKILGYEVKPSDSSAQFNFNVAVQQLKNNAIDPLLGELMHRYGNECHTRFLPKHMDYLEFTLACPTEFSLIICKNTEQQALIFYEKQGILDRFEIGRVDPRDPAESARVKDIIDRFVRDYESFKNANWQISV
jgi:serine/threonine protein kinase